MAHQLLIGKGMITLNLKRIFLALTLLPLFAVAADDCALSDPTLTVQAYTVNPQTERVKMYWQKANGEAWGTLHALLADINSQGQVQMAMNGGIYDESYAPLGLYIENGQQKVALNLASGEGNFFIRPGGVFYVAGDKVGIVRLDAFKTSKEIQFAVQSGPMLMENSVTFRKLSLFCNNLLALYVEGQLMPFSVPLRVDATVTAGVTCAHDYTKRTFALDTPSRYWLNSLSSRNNS